VGHKRKPRGKEECSSDRYKEGATANRVHLTARGGGKPGTETNNNRQSKGGKRRKGQRAGGVLWNRSGESGKHIAGEKTHKKKTQKREKKKKKKDGQKTGACGALSGAKP